ncbi:hypothetical protein BC938DRAFT_482389 [Jimgerdemannia flammicorona]|uniref:DUF7905 domain-containing protein n=1 Tax=Jimgerdemannia flammicorona TaxID=994334 RepID=A0A433QWA6_9FUNG|nr:hypothetical protein BC938DRAFT_482389 [Jimgerdemannia flammicorona]
MSSPEGNCAKPLGSLSGLASPVDLFPADVHFVIHSAWYFPAEAVKNFEPTLKEIGNLTGTIISFDQRKQCFELIGQCHSDLERARMRLNTTIIQKASTLKEDKIVGSVIATPIKTQDPTTGQTSSIRISLDVKYNNDNSSMADTGDISGSEYHEPEAQTYLHPPTVSDDKYDDKDDGPNSPGLPYSKLFTFSRNVDDPSHVLGAHLYQTTNYLKDICDETGTSSDVKGKLQREYMTKIVPVIDYPTASAPYKLYFCLLAKYKYARMVDLHPTVKIHKDKLYVILPVFRNEQNEGYMRPTNLLVDPPRTPQAVLPSVPMIPTVQRQYQQKAYVPAPTANPAPSQRDWKKQHSSQPIQTTYPMPMQDLPGWGEERSWQYSHAKDPNSREASHVQQTKRLQKPFEVDVLRPDEFPPLESTPQIPKLTRPPLVNKGSTQFIVTEKEYQKQRQAEQSAQRLNSNPFDGNSTNGIVDDHSLGRQKDSESATLRKSDIGNWVEKIADPNNETLLRRNRRNMPSQQGDNNTSSPSATCVNKDTALKHLEQVRSHKGEIRFSAKVGKVLWTNVKTDVARNVWDSLDIKDVVVGGHGVKPVFNDITTSSENIVSRIADILPKAFARKAYFEISAGARNQPRADYEKVTMFVNQGYVDLQKVTTAIKKIVEVDWVALDRKFDFQFSLSKRTTVRHDVKPFNTFIKKVSVSPSTKHIAYQNIPGFLEVTQVLFKQTTQFRIHCPFVVEVSRVEDLPLQQQIQEQKSGDKLIDKRIGLTGEGKVWYELEVGPICGNTLIFTSYKDLGYCGFLHNENTETFKENINLSRGTIANWTAEDILGEGKDAAKLIQFVRTMLLFVEKCEPICSDAVCSDVE